MRANARPTMPSSRRSKRCSTPTVAPLRSARTSPCLIVAGRAATDRPATPGGAPRVPAAPRGAAGGGEPPSGRRPAAPATLLARENDRPLTGVPGPADTVVARQGKWRNGRRARFRSVCPKGRGGSTPPLPTQGRPRWWTDLPRPDRRRGRGEVVVATELGDQAVADQEHVDEVGAAGPVVGIGPVHVQRAQHSAGP